jgi:hypothetical protein
MRSEIVTTILQLLGLLIAPVAIALIFAPAGLLVLACELFAVGAYLERE